MIKNWCTSVAKIEMPKCTEKCAKIKQGWRFQQLLIITWPAFTNDHKIKKDIWMSKKSIYFSDFKKLFND